MFGAPVVRITLSQGVCLYICHQEGTLGFQKNPAVSLGDKLRNWCRQARVCTLGRVIQPKSLLQFCPKEWSVDKTWICETLVLSASCLLPYATTRQKTTTRLFLHMFYSFAVLCFLLSPCSCLLFVFSRETLILELDWVAQSCRT